jgi:hypothetical protein
MRACVLERGRAENVKEERDEKEMRLRHGKEGREETKKVKLVKVRVIIKVAVGYLSMDGWTVQ